MEKKQKIIYIHIYIHAYIYKFKFEQYYEEKKIINFNKRRIKFKNKI